MSCPLCPRPPPKQVVGVRSRSCGPAIGNTRTGTGSSTAPTSVMPCATPGAKKKSAAIAALMTAVPLLMTGFSVEDRSVLPEAEHVRRGVPEVLVAFQTSAYAYHRPGAKLAVQVFVRPA